MGIIRLNELPEGSGSLSNDDIFLFMDNPSGSGITKQISLSQIATAIGSHSSSGNFSSLTVNNTGVSVIGHTHVSNDITNFNSSVSGLITLWDAPANGNTYGRKNSTWTDIAQAAALQLRRGTEIERLQVTPLEGEPIYTTDTQKLYIGDGIAVGGKEIVSSSYDSLNPPGMARLVTVRSSGTFSIYVASTTGYVAVLWWDGSVQVFGTGSVIDPTTTRGTCLILLCLSISRYRLLVIGRSLRRKRFSSGVARLGMRHRAGA
jgi:hypothetical protein